MNLKKYNLNIFIIPYHRIGGAEKVHLEIIKSLNVKPIVFFDYSDGTQLLDVFSENAFCFFITNERRQRFVMRCISSLSYIIPITIFGCNSVFYYKLISTIKNKIKTIDLTHAFSLPDKGIETISLPYVNFIDKRIVINNKTLEDYKGLYKTSNLDNHLINRFRIISNGIEIEKFDPNLIKKRFNDFRIGFVGRNSLEKRPSLFFQLFELLYVKKIKAKVIGDDFSEFKEGFVNMEYFEGCNDSKVVRNQFSDISVLIIPSIREGFPLVIMEAMELGIPVISTNVGSISEHVSDDLNGYIVKDNSENEFLKIVYDKVVLLLNDELLYTSMSFNARKYAEDNFNIRNFRLKYRDLFNE